MNLDSLVEIGNKVKSEVVNFPQDLWAILVSSSLPLMSGRSGFEHHTFTAVYEAIFVSTAAIHEKLLQKNPTIILVMAAFFHDLGYAKISTPIYNQDKSSISPLAKAKHQLISADILKKFLQSNRQVVSKYLNQKEQDLLVDIVKNHETPKNFLLEDLESKIIFHLFLEIDSLAAINLKFGKPNFAKDKINSWLARRYLGNDGKVAAYLTDYSKQKFIEYSNDIKKFAGN
jgi:hypothetical protein